MPTYYDPETGEPLAPKKTYYDPETGEPVKAGFSGVESGGSSDASVFSNVEEGGSGTAGSNYASPVVDAISQRSGPFVKGAAQNLNPMEIARALKGLGELGQAVNPATNLSAALRGEEPPMAGVIRGAASVPGALYDQATGTPEEQGELAGNLVGGVLTSKIPVGGILGKVGKWSRESRGKNIVKASGATTPADKLKIKKMVEEDRIHLPVSASRESLLAKVDAELDAVSPKLAKAKESLEPLPKVTTKPVVDDLTAQRPAVKVADEAASKPIEQQFASTKKPKGKAARDLAKLNVEAQKAAAPRPVATEASGNRSLLRAMDSQIDELVQAAGVEGKIAPSALQALKEQFQDAANKAYKAAAEAGQTAGVEAQASERTAAALQKALETHPDIPEPIRKALLEENRRASALLAVKRPMEVRVIKESDQPFLSKSTEMLIGRGAGPAVLGGAGFALSPIGAAAGVGVGAFMQSVLWNTLSAAAKARIAPILESQGVQAATQAAFQAHVAEAAAKRATTTPGSEAGQP